MFCHFWLLLICSQKNPFKPLIGSKKSRVKRFPVFKRFKLSTYFTIYEFIFSWTFHFTLRNRNRKTSKLAKTWNLVNSIRKNGFYHLSKSAVMHYLINSISLVLAIKSRIYVLLFGLSGDSFNLQWKGKLTSSQEQNVL